MEPVEFPLEKEATEELEAKARLQVILHCLRVLKTFQSDQVMAAMEEMGGKDSVECIHAMDGGMKLLCTNVLKDVGW